jgi:DNA-binding NtrC family response regulator
MNEALRLLTARETPDARLRRSFDEAAEALRASRALLLLVQESSAARWRATLARGLTADEIRACERGDAVDGVDRSLISSVVLSSRVRMTEGSEKDTHGRGGGAVCAPVRNAEGVVGVLYFQRGEDDGSGYDGTDAACVEGFALLFGQMFGLHLQEQRRRRDLGGLLHGAHRPPDSPELLGRSPHMVAFRRHLHDTCIPAAEAPDPEPLLILGEKGTGKDLVARYLHSRSARRHQPFVAINCAEITDELASARFFGHKKGAFTGAVADERGLFRAASGGILFLDEIAELSLRSQATLLRVLENRAVVPVGDTREMRLDVYVILATNRDLERAVGEGTLRADFVDRFATQAVRLAPLRERAADVPELAAYLLALHERRTRKKTLGLTPDALRALESYTWPGNVRELARVCSVLVTSARAGAPVDEALLARSCPAVVGAPPPAAGSIVAEDGPMRHVVRNFQRQLVLSRLSRHDWNVREARKSLDLPKTTFHRYMTALGITAPVPAEDAGDGEG